MAGYMTFVVAYEDYEALQATAVFQELFEWFKRDAHARIRVTASSHSDEMARAEKYAEAIEKIRDRYDLDEVAEEISNADDPKTVDVTGAGHGR